jgi:hypothetical protein
MVLMLLVDDLLSLPSTIGKIILNTMAQTVEKVAWAEYSRDLKKVLLQARHDYDEGRLDQTKFREIESHVFSEMRLSRKRVRG